MTLLWKGLIGILSGIVGGMGMGGGTVLVPLLRLVGVSQLVAQGLNLVAFVPMSILALLMHKKHKLIKAKGTIYILIPSVIMAVVGSVIAHVLEGKLLTIIYAVVLVVLGLYMLVTSIVERVRKSK